MMPAPAFAWRLSRSRLLAAMLVSISRVLAPGVKSGAGGATGRTAGLAATAAASPYEFALKPVGALGTTGGDHVPGESGIGVPGDVVAPGFGPLGGPPIMPIRDGPMDAALGSIAGAA